MSSEPRTDQERRGGFRQPRAVWAVAFACVISFMGIGLVDPILPALAHSLDATPSEVSLLFTSYLVVTAVAMLAVNWVSSRLGAKRTMVIGLLLIIVFAGGAGLVNSVTGIVWFRAGWGLGNALFIATSLAVIVASARGGFSGAIILYEAALGLGIAVGPLLGGLLGSISWRGPFFGVSALMFVALLATIFLVPATPRPEHKTSLSAPIKALRHRGLLIMSLVAFFYNWGFFTMLGYAPYPMGLHASQLGLVFTAWGLLVAAFAVWFAPRLENRFGILRVLLLNLAGLAAVMLVIAIWVHIPSVVVAAVIVSGAFIGINNTLTTQAVMIVSPVDRSVASASYGFARFIGGGLAPLAAGIIADATDQSIAFVVGAVAFAVGMVVLVTGRAVLQRAGDEAETTETSVPDLRQVGGSEADRAGRVGPVIVAVGAHETRHVVVDRAADLATREGAPLDVIHVRETEIVGDQAIEPLTAAQAQALVEEQLERVAGRRLAARGFVLFSVGDLGAVGRSLGRYAEEVGARAVVIRRSPGGTAVAAGMESGGADATYSVVLLAPASLSPTVLPPPAK